MTNATWFWRHCQYFNMLMLAALIAQNLRCLKQQGKNKMSSQKYDNIRRSHNGSMPIVQCLCQVSVYFLRSTSFYLPSAPVKLALWPRSARTRRLAKHYNKHRKHPEVIPSDSSFLKGVNLSRQEHWVGERKIRLPAWTLSSQANAKRLFSCASHGHQNIQTEEDNETQTQQMLQPEDTLRHTHTLSARRSPKLLSNISLISPCLLADFTQWS